MEKIMIFGFAIWFGLFISVAPNAFRKDSQKAGSNTAVQANTNSQKAGNTVNQTDDMKKVPVRAVLWHDPR